MITHRTFRSLANRNGRLSPSSRELATEVPVAISYNGATQAVLMATPADLEDLGIGFSLSEGIATSADEIENVAIAEGDRGIDVQLRLSSRASASLEKRRRSMAGPVGCGLCGIESIDEALREVEPVTADTRLSAQNVADAVKAMARAQELNLRTRSVHAAGFFRPGAGLVAIREDIGRHNALDKLVGAMAVAGETMATGAVVMTSRISVDLVQKTAAAGAGILVAVSAPTTLAVEAAERANVTLVAVVRDRDFELFTCPDRIDGGLKHVA